MRGLCFGRAALVAAALCAASSPSYADSIVVAPVADASGFETQFNLTLDVSAACYLCAGWAETDQGANYADWTNLNFKVLGEVDSSTTSWTFDAPKGWGDDIRALRFFLVEKETAPYDQRLEYIESTGQEWVNTGYIGNSEDHYYLHFAWISGGEWPMGAMPASVSNSRYGVLNLESGRFGVALNSVNPIRASVGDKFPANRRLVVSGEEVYTHTQIKTGAGYQFVHVSTKGFDDFDDTSMASRLNGASSAPNNKIAPLFIFACNTGCTSTDVTQGGTTDNACAMRLWSCYATHTEGTGAPTPVLDLVPCVKDGEAMLYDRVNTRFLRNVSGAGAFIAGPAIDERLLGSDVASSAAVAPSQGTLDAVANPPAVRTVSVGQVDASGRIEAVLSRASAPGYLYVAYGSAAGGDTPESWQNCDLVGFFDKDPQKAVATVPGWGTGVTAMRFFLKDAQTLPFDAQVEWIRSTGNEYLDTERVFQLGDVYTISFRAAKTDADYILVGACGTAGLTQRIQMQIVGYASGTSRDLLRYAYAYNNSNNGNDNGDAIEVAADTTMRMEFSSGSQTMSVGRTGSALSVYKTSTYSGDPACKVSNYIFARHRGDTTSGVDQKATARIYSVKVENGGETAQDFIPVVKDGAAGMYDRQNGTLHWNKGTGAFTAGPEIANSNFKPGASLVAMSAVQQCEFRTIAVSDVATGANGETLGFRLALGPAVQNETCRLVFAYGAADGGDDPASWDGCMVAGTVAPGDASFDFTIPSGLVSGSFKYRFFLVADGAGSPGVTEVPYIESTGSEYINTGYIGTFDDVYDVSYRNLMAANASGFILGSYAPTVNNGRYTVVQIAGGSYGYYFNSTGKGTAIKATPGEDHRVRVSISYGEQKFQLSTDGGATYSAFGTLNASEEPVNTTAPLYLFARNCNNTSVDNKATARLYSCTIRHNGEIVRDFTPCVKNGEAGVYDRVLGRFHGNISDAGTLAAATDDAVASPAVYSCTASGDGTGSDVASKAGAISSIAAEGRVVTVKAPVSSLGAGTTYAYLEWWVDGGGTTNTVALSAIPAGGSAGTQTATFDAGNIWGQTIYCRFAVSNTYATATAGTAAYHDKSYVRSVAIDDDAIYTWQAADGEWNGSWLDPAHWSSSRPGNCIGYPTATATAKFAAGTTAVVSMPDGLVEVGRLTVNEKNIDITFLNAGNAATLKPVNYFTIPTDTKGASWNSRIVFDGVSVQKKDPASAVYVCNDSSLVLRGGAKINSTKVVMMNDGASGKYTGRLEIGAGSVWPASGEATQIQLNGDGVVSVEGTFNVQKFLMGQGGACYYGGGTLELCGANPSVNVSGEFRCRNTAGYVNPSYIAFDIPADGWASAPLKGGASAAALAGTSKDSPNVQAKIVVEVPADAPVIAARNGKRTPFKVPLIDWPKGITVDRCELVAGKPSRVRFAWTYGETGSEEDDGNPPTGLVAYVTGAPGLMIVVQ